MLFFNCSTPKNKKSTFGFYTLLCISASILGLGANVAVEALEKAYAVDMNFDDIVTTSDLATAIVTCAVFLLLKKFMQRNNLKAQAGETQPLVFNDPELQISSLKIKNDQSSLSAPFKKYASETTNIILSVGMGAGSGIGVDVLEKKYIGDVNLSYLTISDVTTCVMTLVGYGLFKKVLDKYCQPKNFIKDDDIQSKIFNSNL